MQTKGRTHKFLLSLCALCVTLALSALIKMKQKLPK